MLLLSLLLCLQDPAALVDGLRSDSIDERDHATRELLKLGKAVFPLLGSLQSDPDPEVAARAAHILRGGTTMTPLEARLRVEQTLITAKSVHLRFTHVEPRMEKALSGELWVKGDKIRGHLEAGAGSSALQILSDGKKLRVERSATTPEVVEVAEGQGRDLLIGVVRFGAHQSMIAKASRIMLEGRHVGGETRPAPGILCHFQSGRCGDRLMHELTLTAKGLPAKHESWFEGVESQVETYEIFLGEEIPDERFELPRK